MSLSNGGSGNEPSKRRVASFDILDPPDITSTFRLNSSGQSSSDVDSFIFRAAKLHNDAAVQQDPMAARSIGTGVVVGLHDIIQTNPLESEAETHILRALEERDPTLPRRSSSTRSSFLLSQVPDDVLHNFNPEPSSNTGKDRRTQQEGKEENIAAAQTAWPKPPTAAAAVAVAPTPVSRKPQDIEQELFGLTTALRAIHAGDLAQLESLEHDVVGGAPSLAGENEPPNAADTLAMNAGILFRRNVRTATTTIGETADAPISTEQERGETTSIPVSSDVKAKRNWTKVRAAVLLTSKKTDNDSSPNQAVDPELGESTSPGSSGGNSTNNINKNNNNNNNNQSQQPTKSSQSSSYSPFFGHLNPPELGKAVRDAAKRTTSEISNDLHVFRAFFRPRHATVFAYCKSVLFYFIIPALSIAAILFYFVDNPHTGRRSHRTDGQKPRNGSISWWIIFLCVRQVITLSLALAIQALFIDFFALRTRLTLRLCGPVLTLLIVQSKGWPFTFFCWGLLDLFTLAGPGRFAKHWLFYQPWIGLFNEENPSGKFISSHWNYRILAVAICVSFVVAVKRVAIGLYLGRRTFSNYSRQLTQVMHSMFLISEVASLAKSIQTRSQSTRFINVAKSNAEAVFGWRARCMSEEDPSEKEIDEEPDKAETPGTASAGRNPYESSSSGLSASQRMIIKQALEDWEEPESSTTLPSTISVSAILQFRQALAFMSNDYPFSVSFGPADTRDACIQSSQLVYDNLILHTPGEEDLKFDTLSVLAKDQHGSIDQQKVKDLIRLFRPNRDGYLSKIDFIKSVDSVYKSMRLLRASVEAAAKIDTAFESIFNVGFYVVTACVALSILGFNPLTLFLSLSGIIVSFAFMIGSAASKYFEGVLFILVRRPYDIGDKIHVSNVESNTDSDGSSCWTVDDVSLFTTTVIYGSTNERATMSNGSLASSRIINANRSPKAVIYIRLKFGVEVPYEKVKIFKTVVEQFVKARPREWLALNNFRASGVELDQGFIQYVISAQHRESWQRLGAILNSKADLSSFCLEVMKKMDMGYTSPPLPVELSLKSSLESLQRSDNIINNEQNLSMARTIDDLFPHR